MPEITSEEFSKELARQIIRHVIETLNPNGTSIPSVHMTLKYDPSQDNPVAWVPGIHERPDFDVFSEKCPLCKEDWHGVVGEGTNGDLGCPGEFGSDEEKMRWLEKRPCLVLDDAMLGCIGFLEAALDMLSGDEPTDDA